MGTTNCHPSSLPDPGDLVTLKRSPPLNSTQRNLAAHLGLRIVSSLTATSSHSLSRLALCCSSRMNWGSMAQVYWIFCRSFSGPASPASEGSSVCVGYCSFLKGCLHQGSEVRCVSVQKDKKGEALNLELVERMGLVGVS